MQKEDEVPRECLQTLSQKFGHKSFRPHQWKIIKSILDGQDNLAVMATGYGKSLCFQFPSVHRGGVTLVVSPLISLMEDQVLALNLCNIPSCFLGSAQSSKEVLRDVFAGAYRMVYVTPEYISGGDFTEVFSQRLQSQVGLVAIDEAHCVSQWGHDFRPAYRKLSRIRSLFPKVPILAVTATATSAVQKDIVQTLGLRNHQFSCSGFDRPNLEFQVHLKSTSGVWTDLKGLLQGDVSGSTIIYCITRKQTEETSQLLKARGIHCEIYHAGLSVKKRREVHERFVRDQIQIIIATIAFGMGIDKPDVRLVIHYGASKDLESYYQEVGRAGRDGEPSRCVMFYNSGDLETLKRLRQSSNFGAAQEEHQEKLAQKMFDFLNTRECRRWFILKYFEGEGAQKPANRPNCCDNCRRALVEKPDSERYESLDADGKHDFTEDAKKFLGAVKDLNGKKGMTFFPLFLLGSKDKSIPGNFMLHSLYGSGKSRPKDWWRSLGSLLEHEGFLKKVKLGFKINNFIQPEVLSVTSKALKWLENPETLKLVPTQDMFKFLKLKRCAPLVDSPSSSASRPLSTTPIKPRDSKVELVKELIKERSKIAAAIGVMPYMVASDPALGVMADRKPLNLNEFRAANIPGFSDIKVSKFGKSFIEVIQRVMQFLPSGEPKSMRAILESHPVSSDAKVTDMVELTFDLLKSGKGIDEISTSLGRARSTTVGYLNKAILCGLAVTKDDLKTLGVDEKTFNHIASKLPRDNLREARLSPIKELCSPAVEWDQIRFVLSYVTVRWHLKDIGASFVDPDAAVRPEIDSEEPESYSKVPESYSKVPESYSNMPESYSKVPEINSIPPKTETNDDLDDDDELFLQVLSDLDTMAPQGEPHPVQKETQGAQKAVVVEDPDSMDWCELPVEDTKPPEVPQQDEDSMDWGQVPSELPSTAESLPKTAQEPSQSKKPTLKRSFKQVTKITYCSDSSDDELASKLPGSKPFVFKTKKT